MSSFRLGLARFGAWFRIAEKFGEPRGRDRLARLVAWLALAFAPACLAQEAAPKPEKPPEIPPPRVVAAYGSSATDTELEVSDRLCIEVENLDGWLGQPNADGSPRSLKSLRVFLNGNELSGCEPVGSWPATGKGRTVIAVRLAHTAGTRTVLEEALVSPDGSVTVAAGPAGGATFASAGPYRIQVVSVGGARRWLITLGVGVLAFAFILTALRSNFMRDRDADATGYKSFSLSRCQAVIWFVVIMGTFVGLAVTWKTAAVFSTTALILLGISGAAALGAEVIDGKSGGAPAPAAPAAAGQAPAPGAAQPGQPAGQQPAQGAAPQPAGQQPAQPAAPVAQSQSFAQQISALPKDLLTDKDGPVLHRIQMLIWTVILAAFFVVEAWRKLAMPEFDQTVLALLGLSAGTYLGFKLPEKKY